jgi:ferredoxin-NADP reductase
MTVADRRPGTPWQSAKVVEIRRETQTAKTFRLALTQPTARRAGQHFLVRLTAPDGYTATRSYSVANAPDDVDVVELTVERLHGGEVSPFLHDVVMVGDELEVRGPIGQWFVWDGTSRALLIGGGSGVVPLMAMLRQARGYGREELVRLVVSVRTRNDLYYADEIEGARTTIVYTRAAPPGATRAPGHLAAADLPSDFLTDAGAFVCGSPAFADAATDLLVAGRVPANTIRVERFGPSG